MPLTAVLPSRAAPAFLIGPLAFLVAVAGLLGLAGPAAATFNPSLVKDINSATETSAPTTYTDVGGTAFFTADDGIHGRELWVSDGTAGGTEMVEDIYPGATSGLDDNGEIVSFDGRAFFSARTPGEGYEVWTSDGTPGGTEILKDIDPGSDFNAPREFEIHDGELFFAADDGSGEGLWKTDGTALGTVKVAAVAVDYDLTSIGGMLLFGHKATSGHELWKSDGTGPGTEKVKVLDTGVGGFEGFTMAGGEIFFSAGDPLGENLFKTDGTGSGTELVVGEMSIHDLASAGGKLLFKGDGELWSSDGTSAGTGELKDINPSGASGPQPFGNVGGDLLFSADDGTTGRELWKSDGTGAGTTRVKDIYPGAQSAAPEPSAILGGELYFGADDGADGRELWKSDGTGAGTAMVADLRPGSGDGLPLTPFSFGMNDVELMQFGTVGTSLFLNAENGSTGIEPWVSDGTAGGTALIEDVNVQPAGSLPADLTDVGGTLYFRPGEPLLGLEPWKSDGTEGGTGLLKDIVPGSGSGVPNDNQFIFDENQFTNVGGRLFFSAVDETNGRELWVSDGTVAGTKLVEDINPGFEGSEPYYLTPVGDTVFFVADDGTHGRELWKSDGTPGGTDIVKDVQSGTSGAAKNVVNVGGTVFFGATDGSNGIQLWKSDGSPGGTEQVKDPASPGQTGDPRELTEVDGNLFFIGGSSDRELWISDGSDGGTEQVANINPSGSAYLGLLTDVGGTLFFRALNGSAFGLYSSDGTEETTTELTTAVDPKEITELGDLAVFRGDGGPDGGEPWISDGTPGGTEQLKDVRPGATGSSPSSFTNVGGTLLFSADDGSTGRELWQTTGTPGSTVPAGEIVAGAEGGNPSGLTTVGATLFFVADDGLTGPELWKAVDGGPDTIPPRPRSTAVPATARRSPIRRPRSPSRRPSPARPSSAG